MPEHTARLQRLRQWLRKHRLLSLIILTVLILLLILNVKNISFAVFRLYAQDCGSLSSHQGFQDHQVHQVLDDGAKVRQAESCFWQAVQRCHAAFFTYTSTNTDAGTKETFTVADNFGKCSLSDNAEFIGMSRGGATYTCGGLIRKTDGLHFLDCSQAGEIIVPRP